MIIGIHFHCARGFRQSPLTRIHVRLLGPCFKTGRMEHRLFAHRERPSSDSCPAPKELTVGGTRRGHRRIPRVDTRRKLAGRQQAGVADQASLGFLRNSNPFGSLSGPLRHPSNGSRRSTAGGRSPVSPGQGVGSRP